MTSTYLLGVAAALVATVFVAEMLRRGVLKEKFAALWLVVCAGLLMLAVFPGALMSLSTFLGVEVPSNLLFFAAAVVLLLVSVQLSYEVSKLESRTRRLAEEVAMLRIAVHSIPQRTRREPAAHPNDSHAAARPR